MLEGPKARVDVLDPPLSQRRRAFEFTDPVEVSLRGDGVGCGEPAQPAARPGQAHPERRGGDHPSPGRPRRVRRELLQEVVQLIEMRQDAPQFLRAPRLPPGGPSAITKHHQVVSMIGHAPALPRHSNERPPTPELRRTPIRIYHRQGCSSRLAVPCGGCSLRPGESGNGHRVAAGPAPGSARSALRAARLATPLAIFPSTC